jgi:hypothetical protein
VLVSIVRARSAAHLAVILALGACVALPLYAFWNGQTMSVAAVAGLGVGRLPRLRGLAAAVVVLTAFAETPPAHCGTTTTHQSWRAWGHSRRTCRRPLAPASRSASSSTRGSASCWLTVSSIRACTQVGFSWKNMLKAGRSRTSEQGRFSRSGSIHPRMRGWPVAVYRRAMAP